MKRVRSIYADLYVKGSYRARFTPRVSRHRRPHVIAWAGPAAFAINRFYKLDKWYKARIEKPEILPQLHIIDPDNFEQSLEERLSVNKCPRIDIGFKERQWLSTEKEQQNKSEMEKLARKLKINVDQTKLHYNNIALFNHFHIFDDLFGANVFFHNTQRMTISFPTNDVVYSGNVIPAVATNQKPNVDIESIGDGFNTLLALNLDGNPYILNSEILHWMVANIKDADNTSKGEEIVPYMQALPFRGSGFHRFVFLLFRHHKKLDFTRYGLNGSSLFDRTFLLRKFYKENEDDITPSAVSFSQVTWDISVNDFLHKIGMKAPFYRYQFRPKLKMKQKEFPNKPQPFDCYLDQFRDPVEMETEVLKKRLAIRTLCENPVRPKYPDISFSEHRQALPHWQHTRILKENAGVGRFYALWNNPID